MRTRLAATPHLILILLTSALFIPLMALHSPPPHIYKESDNAFTISRSDSLNGTQLSLSCQPLNTKLSHPYSSTTNSSSESLSLPTIKSTIHTNSTSISCLFNNTGDGNASVWTNFSLPQWYEASGVDEQTPIEIQGMSEGLFVFNVSLVRGEGGESISEQISIQHDFRYTIEGNTTNLSVSDVVTIELEPCFQQKYRSFARWPGPPVWVGKEGVLMVQILYFGDEDDTLLVELLNEEELLGDGIQIEFDELILLPFTGTSIDFEGVGYFNATILVGDDLNQGQEEVWRNATFRFSSALADEIGEGVNSTTLNLSFLPVSEDYSLNISLVCEESAIDVTVGLVGNPVSEMECVLNNPTPWELNVEINISSADSAEPVIGRIFLDAGVGANLGCSGILHTLPKTIAVHPHSQTPFTHSIALNRGELAATWNVTLLANVKGIGGLYTPNQESISTVYVVTVLPYERADLEAGAANEFSKTVLVRNLGNHRATYRLSLTVDDVTATLSHEELTLERGEESEVIITFERRLLGGGGSIEVLVTDNEGDEVFDKIQFEIADESLLASLGLSGNFCFMLFGIAGAGALMFAITRYAKGEGAQSGSASSLGDNIGLFGFHSAASSEEE